jgi:hypothetical protein
VLLAASAFLVWRLYGPAFFQSLLFSREYSWHQAFRDSGAAIKCFVPIVVLSLLLLPRARANERNEFAAVYLVMTAVFAGILSGGIGVDINKYFDFMIAASLCAALEVEHLWSIPLPGPLRAFQAGPALTLLLGAYLGAYAASLMPGVARDLRGLDALERQTRADSRFVAETGRGRAACETPELCYWGKSPFLLDAFDYGQRLKLGQEPADACESVFDGRRIALLQLDPNDGQGSPQLTPACNAVIRRNYRQVSASALGTFLESASEAADR